MPGARDLVIKPACMNEIHALPGRVMANVLEKVKGLAHDPLPDGSSKIKLAVAEGVYRLRVGDYRVLYSFGETWIRLLGIRHRKEAYSPKHEIAYEEPGVLPPDVSVGDLPEEASTLPGAPAAAGILPRGLPRPLTADWLSELKVPPESQAVLCRCLDEDTLLAAPVPPWVLERVVDNLWPRPIEEVVRQPDLAVPHPDDLQRYKDGDLFGFLLLLDNEQARLVDWGLRGPSIIKGGPGTGKSTVALYRVKSLLDRAAAQGREPPRILFTTYTNALTRSSEQLLRHLLGGRTERVTVSTADRMARTVVERVETAPTPADPQALSSTLNDVRKRFQPSGRNRFDQAVRRAALDRLRTEYLLAEFEWIIEGRSLATVEEYRQADRTGRGVALHADARAAVWDLYQEFQSELTRRNLATYGSIRRRALEILRAGRFPDRFDAVIIDEAQDLTPTGLSMLVELCQSPEGLYLTADAGQSLYARGFTWRQVHERLQFRGRTALLKRNYRTSHEITVAAVAFLRAADAGDPECLNPDCVHSGPKPMLLCHSTDAEQWERTAQFIRSMTRRFRLQPQAAAVLAPTNNLADQAATELTRVGVPARFVRGGDLDLQAHEVKVFTLHSAKGLEFPVVAIVGLREGTIPRLRDHTPEEVAEEIQAFRRLLFVGMTRAMRALILAYPAARPSPFVAELDRSLWAEHTPDPD